MRNILKNFEEIIGSILFLFMLSLTFANVVARYLLTASLSYTEEITVSLFVLLTMLGTAIAAKRQSHLGLSLFTEMFHPTTQKRIAVAANLLGMAFSLILLITSFEMVVHEYLINQLSISLQIPQWIYGSFLPFGAILMSFRFFEAAKENFKSIKAGEKNW